MYLGILAQGALAVIPNDLAGIWVLDSVEQGAQVSRDPRWTCWLEFDSGGQFWLSSTSVTEEHLQGKPGTQTTRAVRHEVQLKGTCEVEAGDLLLRPTGPLTPEQLNFARANLGGCKDGLCRVGLQLQGGLQLVSGARRLYFRRHEKTAR